MDLVNETDLQAALYRSVLPDPDRLLGVVVARATYTVDSRGRLTRDHDAPVPVSRDPIELPSGVLPGDQIPRKEGVDLLALGHVRAPGESPVHQLAVTLLVGDFGASIMAYGDRVWRRKTAERPMLAGSVRRVHPALAAPAPEVPEAVEFDPGEPTPFMALPMNWERAYGGEASVGDRRIPHADNALGRGYLVLPGSSIEGTALPNLEDPGALIVRATDAPRPLCLAPMPKGSLLQAEGATTVDDATGAIVVNPRFFNVAHPRFRVPEVRGGEVVTLTGMTAGEPFTFTVPALPLRVEVALEKRRYAFPIRIDTLCLLPDERRVVVTFRCPFTYRYIREEIRTARLFRAPAATATSSTES